MAPFPENEIMTIKRLEVALRRSDFKLLKEGSYKLHEKFHSGHYFEYTDLLKDILEQVSYNYGISSDIKDILIPTIKDILTKQGIEVPFIEATPSEYDSNRVSSLTSLSYDIDSNNEQNEVLKQENNSEPNEINKINEPINEEIQEEKYDNEEINEEINEGVNEEETNEESSYQEETPSQQTYDEFTPIETIVPAYISNSNEEIKKEEEKEEFLPLQEGIQQAQIPQDIEEQPIQQQMFTNDFNQQSFQQEMPQYDANEQLNQNNAQENFQYEHGSIDKYGIKDEKTISIFFGQSFSNEKIKNIINFKNLILSNNFRIDEIANLINEINTQSNISMQELQMILEKLKTKENPINLITNSQSSDLINILESNGVDYGFFNNQENKNFNIFPLLGLTNYFKCNQCNEMYLNKSEITPYFVQCPKCKGVMQFDLYIPNGEINVDYYNSCMETLVDSNIWFLIHPILNDKLTMNLLKYALKLSNKVEKIYILEKDINTREVYKNLFGEISPMVDINVSINATEDFLNSL